MTLPPTWILVTLDKVVTDIQPGFAQRPNSELIGTPQLRTNNVSPEGNLDLSEVKYVDATDKEIAAYSVRRGDVIFNNTNSIEWVGKTAYFDLDEPFVISNHMTRIRVKEDVLEPEYLARYLHFLWRTGNVQRFAKQWVNQAAIDQRGLAQLEIILPTLPEQRRIVEILRQADALRRLRRESNSVLEHIRVSLFVEMFGQKVADEQTWDVRKISDLGDVSYGLTVNRQRREASTQYPYLRVANVYAWRLDINEIATIGVLEDDLRRYRLKRNDVLVVEGHGDRSQLGRAAVWNAQIDPCLHQNHLLRVRPFADVVSPHYLAGYINSPQGRAYMLRYGKTSSGLNTINSTVLANMPLPYPPLSLQRDYETRLLTYDALEADHKTSSIRFEDLFKSVLAQSFSGLLTQEWRSTSAKELADLAVQRDIALGLRGEEPTHGDYKRGHVTQAEREEIERRLSDSLRPVLSQMAQYNPLGETLRAIQDSQSRWAEQLAQIVQPISFQLPAIEITPLLSDAVSNAMLGVQSQFAALAEANQSAIEAITSQFASIASISHSISETFAASLQPITAQLTSVIEALARAIDEWPPSDHPRFDVVIQLDRRQKLIHFACERQEDPFTVEAIQAEVGLSQESVRRALDLFASLGLLASVSIPAESADGPMYVAAYQTIGYTDDFRLTDLALLKEPGQA